MCMCTQDYAKSFDTQSYNSEDCVLGEREEEEEEAAEENEDVDRRRRRMREMINWINPSSLCTSSVEETSNIIIVARGQSREPFDGLVRVSLETTR